MISPADAEPSEKLYQLAEIIGVSRTLSGTLRLWALVVDAASCDASAMSEGLLATLIQEDDTESEEPAARCDPDSLLERTMRMGWERNEKGERDVEQLMAATMEAIEEDVFDHAIFQ